MQTVQRLVGGVIVLAVCGMAVAQDSDVPLSIARFESEADYQRYSDWMADLENIRFALIASGKTWSPEVEAWAKDYVQKPAKVESNDGIYLVTYAEGGIDAGDAEQLLFAVTNSYGEWLQRRQSDAEAQDKDQLERELAELQERSAETGIAPDVKDLQSQLTDISSRLLEARLEAAQAEARARTVMDHVETKYAVATPEAKKAEEARRAVLESKLHAAETELAQVKKLAEKDFTTTSDVERANVKVLEAQAELAALEAESAQRSARVADTEAAQRAVLDKKLEGAQNQLARTKELHERGATSDVELRRAELEMMQTKAELAELEARSIRQASTEADADLKRLMIDAESARASALALEKVLSEQESVLREKIIRSLDYERRVDELERRLGRNVPQLVRRQPAPVGYTLGAPNLIRPEAREELMHLRRQAR